jgi:hypothetical protein
MCLRFVFLVITRLSRGGGFERTETLGICEGDDLVSARYHGTTVIDLDFHGLPLSRPREPREPDTGANVCRLPQTDRDDFRAFLQARGFPADSVRPIQTGYS